MSWLTAPHTLLILGQGAQWEAELLPRLPDANMVVVRRCVDLVDLLAAAALRQASLALVDANAVKLDAEAIAMLAADNVALIVVGAAADEVARYQQLQVAAVVGTSAEEILAGLSYVTQQQAATKTAEATASAIPAEAETLPVGAEQQGKVITVWGPSGAPGRTTVALGLAAMHAAQRQATLVVDVDERAGTVAQRWGLLEEASGVLAAARLVNQGRLTRLELAALVRQVSSQLQVLTGIPRPDRHVELRPQAVTELLATAVTLADVVVDAGEGQILEAAPGSGHISQEATMAADQVVIVAGAEPEGLVRLARALAEFGQARPELAPHVVINRMRPSLGWQDSDVRGMVHDYIRPASVHLLPLDHASLDKTLTSGATLTEVGKSRFRDSLTQLYDALMS